MANIVTKAEQLRHDISEKTSFINRRTALLMAVWVGTGIGAFFVLQSMGTFHPGNTIDSDPALTRKLLAGSVVLPFIAASVLLFTM